MGAPAGMHKLFSVLAGLLLLAGCTSSQPDSSDPSASVPSTPPTSDEYHRAFAALQECIVAAGFPEPIARVSPVTGHSLVFAIDMGLEPDPDGAAAAQTCLERWWQTSDPYEASQPIEMDPGVLKASLDCLRESGLAMTGTPRTPGQMISATVDAPDDIEDRVVKCVSSAVYSLFPEFGGIVVPLNR